MNDLNEMNQIDQPPQTQCIKVAKLRNVYPNQDIDLQKWMEMPGNLYVGRRGRIFITHQDKTKEIFHYPASKWANPYKLSEYSLQDSLNMYRQYVLNGPLKDQLKELKNKRMGCFCMQSETNCNCHAQVLVELYKLLILE